MTTSRCNATTDRHDVRAGHRRRLVAPLLVTALAVAGAGALSGVSGPDPVGAGIGHDEVAIPGVRGTGSGGGGYYGLSSSPGRTELAIPRKAGGLTPEYL